MVWRDLGLFQIGHLQKYSSAVWISFTCFWDERESLTDILLLLFLFLLSLNLFYLLGRMKEWTKEGNSLESFIMQT